jgi:mannan polymerase II complex MNN11 subunit
MLKSIPVVPPDSVIRTFSHISPNAAHLILSQDMDNLAHTSFLLKNTPRDPSNSASSSAPDPDDNWAHFLLDAWFDPLYRTYAFQKAENHALEHLVQWHPTVLAKLVLIPQRRINSYNFAMTPRTDEHGVVREHDSMWSDGDLVATFKGCEETTSRDCEGEMRGYWKRWESEVERLDGRKPEIGIGVQKIVKESVSEDEKNK